MDTKYTLDTPRPSDYFLVMPDQPDSTKRMGRPPGSKNKHSKPAKPKRQLHPNSLANLRPGELITPGRKPGQLNKDTRTLKTAISDLVNTNGRKLQQWLDEIYEQDGPVKAWQCFGDMLEYSLPKLARVEHTGQDGAPIQVVQVSFQGVQQAMIAPKPNQVETLSPLDMPILSQDHRVETNLIETTGEEYIQSKGVSSEESD